ncbi:MULTISPECIES: ABC transporter substrate-binding protein [unclassified Paenibacillus]|uniref:ABC transporter substrate-binding protein n=1 Tax=unclassified Paenibacillus TaxID=185978 RepID=UPI001AEA59E9|nr:MULTISPECIES: ABC transporter substrate-binding protein [unclassified Paenibacillus]MBP1154455.1 NitT/TauT family transport system substrate-binding protein [Paenibacillus sp. PvP091]MBP1170161.1 NitT/TauT family transport system substrate-binding protein [Paenibacillus sp. PvR098]MBP2441189.1 NitT/TauT family transport system substrate-binding protein [Paenibacillus sp. PvP052]
MLMAFRKKGLFLYLLLVCIMLAVTACGKENTTASESSGNNASSAGSEASQEKMNVKIAYGVDTSFSLLPSLVAWDMLKEKGVDVTTDFLAKPNLSVQSVVQGGHHISAGNSPTNYISAADGGASMKMFWEEIGMSWLLVASPEIQNIKDLEGKRIAVHSETSTTNAIYEWLVKTYELKDTKKMIIPGSEVRAQAVINGQTDATLIELSDFIAVENSNPGKIHDVFSFAKEYPEIINIGMAVDSKWAANHPETMELVVTTLAEASKKINNDPEFAVQQGKKYFPDIEPAIVEATIRSFIENGIWDTTGGLTEESTKKSMEFFIETGTVKVDPAALDLSKYFDFDALKVLTP